MDKGNQCWKFYNVPHLTNKAVRKHFPESGETAQGHMINVKQGIRKEGPRQYTKQTEEEIELTESIEKEYDIFWRLTNPLKQCRLTKLVPFL